ncbi:hypothetical protein AURDEDRAFT_137206 [Auricularia subglabra TFB-10046 SS5]|nr:hypothetical protein AURDEDRAFT_137206 [Auricularia subglabra TFB-10046 SS5]
MLFVHVLLALTAGKTLRNFPIGRIVYIFALFAFASCYFGSIIRWGQNMWIDYSGGPIAFYYEDFWIPVSVFSSSVFIITNFLADGLMLYRCWIVWGRSRVVIAVPFLTFLGSSALSCVAVYQVTTPGQRLFSSITLQFMLPYFSMSMGLNILVTLLISARLLLARHRIRSVLGAEHTKVYISITAMLVESAALYSLFSCIFIATYSINDALFNVFLPLHSQIMCISPLLILLRVAKGQAFTESIDTSGATISWHTPSSAGNDIEAVSSMEKGEITIAMESAPSLYQSKSASHVDMQTPQAGSLGRG